MRTAVSFYCLSKTFLESCFDGIYRQYPGNSDSVDKYTRAYRCHFDSCSHLQTSILLPRRYGSDSSTLVETVIFSQDDAFQVKSPKPLCPLGPAPQSPSDVREISDSNILAGSPWRPQSLVLSALARLVPNAQNNSSHATNYACDNIDIRHRTECCTYVLYVFFSFSFSYRHCTMSSTPSGLHPPLLRARRPNLYVAPAILQHSTCTAVPSNLLVHENVKRPWKKTAPRKRSRLTCG